MRVPTSIPYHLADIYLEELEKALSSSPSALPAPLLIVLKPFFSLAATTQNKTMYQRIQSALLDPLFSALSDEVYSSDGPPSKRARLGENDFPILFSNACLEKPKTEGRVKRAELKNKLVRGLLEISGPSDGRESNKRRLHAFCKERVDSVDAVE